VMDKIKAAENGYPLLSDDDIIQPAPRRRRSLFWYSAAAAILAAVCIFAWHYSATPSPASKLIASRWLQQTTRPTKKSVVTLADGTVVTLNSSTSLKYPDRFDAKTREVYLDGEAYFDVFKDALHPFIIHTSKMNIRVLGTSFNVKSYPGETLSETTLIRGSIEVTLNDRPSDRIILKPKEKLVVQNSTGAIKKQDDGAARLPAQDNAAKGTRYSLTNLTYLPNNEKMVVETSWLENKLVFSDKDFVDISGQLERWYGMHFEFGNDRVKDYRFTGLFEKESLPQVLDALKMVEHFRYKITNATVYIY